MPYWRVIADLKVGSQVRSFRKSTGTNVKGGVPIGLSPMTGEEWRKKAWDLEKKLALAEDIQHSLLDDRKRCVNTLKKCRWVLEKDKDNYGLKNEVHDLLLDIDR